MDEALLNRAIEISDCTPLVRIYRWPRPALSLGAHQRMSQQLVRRCEMLGVELVRRATGGSAVLHGDDLTYCVVAPHGSMGVMAAYRWVAQGLVAGLSRLGLEAYVAEHPPRNGRDSRDPRDPRDGRDRRTGSGSPHAPAACFDTATGADLQVAGAKICGSAQLRRKGYFLQHGSIPIGGDHTLSRRLLSHHPGANSTCLRKLRPGTSWDEAAQGLITGFEDVWGRCSYAGEELLLAERLRRASRRLPNPLLIL